MRYGLGVVDERCLWIGGAETSGWVPESWFSFLSLDSCRDPDGGQILTSADALSSFTLVRVRKEVSGVGWKASFVSLRYLLSRDRPVYLFSSLQNLGINMR